MESIVYIETTAQRGISSGSYMDDEDHHMMADMNNSSAEETTSNMSNLSDLSDLSTNNEPKEKIIRQYSGVSWMM